MLSRRLSSAAPLLAALAIAGSGTASSFYDLTIIADTGSSDSSGSPYSSFLSQSASINDHGTVSFVGTNALGQSVYVGDGSVAADIVSLNPPSSTRLYSSGTQINNENQVIARDRLGSANLIRVWDGDLQDPFITIVRGNPNGGTPTFPAAYSAVLSHPTLSNAPGAGLDPFVAFSALDIDLPLPDTVLATPSVLGTTNRFNFFEFQVAAPIRPMISDEGRVVLRAGNLATDPIESYTPDLAQVLTVADSSLFSALGQSPGISDDGRIIAFYGDLNAAGATALSSSAGPGIFARIERLCVSPGPNGALETAAAGDDKVSPTGVRGGEDSTCSSTAAGDDRQLVAPGVTNSQLIRVAGLGGNGAFDPGETCLDLNGNEICEPNEAAGSIFGFQADTRVGVSRTGAVVFLATDLLGDLGLYAGQIEFIRGHPSDSARAAVTRSPRVIASVGEDVAGVGEISNLAVYDPVNNNNRGEVTFWLSTTSGAQAIVRAVDNCSDATYTNPSGNPDIHQYNAGSALDLPDSGGGTAGGNACGASSVSMALNSFKLANFESSRANLWDPAEYNQTAGLSSVYGVTALNLPIPVGSQNNLFSWTRARNWLRAIGFTNVRAIGLGLTPPTVATLKAWIDDNLAQGIPVIASTAFSSKARSSANPYGGGHVILLVGRTFNGDYIVKDPAGDYFAGSDTINEHYGLSRSCGGNAVYPEGAVKLRLARRSGGVLQLPGGGSTTDIDLAAGRMAIALPATADPDPTGFQVTGRFDGPGDRPYYLWVEDDQGRRAGFLPDGTIATEIPEGRGELTPLYPSDPEADDDSLAPRSEWPATVSVDDLQGDLTIFVESIDATDFSLDVSMIIDARTYESQESGVLAAGEREAIPVPEPATPMAVVTVFPFLLGLSRRRRGRRSRV